MTPSIEVIEVVDILSCLTITKNTDLEFGTFLPSQSCLPISVVYFVMVFLSRVFLSYYNGEDELCG